MTIKSAARNIKIKVAIKIHETSSSILERDKDREIAASQAKLAETTLVPGCTQIYA